MGGNLSVNGKQADKVDLKFVGVDGFRSDFHELFLELSRMFKKEFGEPLWNAKELENAEVYNGSTSFIMSKNYSVEDILQYKPKSGDIDIITPHQYGGNLVTFLKKLEGKEIMPNISYRGSNRDNSMAPGGQINCIFDYTVKGKTIGVQVDFELIGGSDMTWKRFSHSSSFADAKKGVKGYSHKMLMRAIHFALSMKKDVLVVTPTAKCDNWEKKLKKVQPGKISILKFSVDKGVSAAYEPVQDCDGNDVQKDGLYVWKELKSKDRKNHETNLNNIFKRIFGFEPNDKELDQLWSYVGLMELIRKHSDKKTQALVFERLFELFWGDGKDGRQKGQEIEAGIKGAEADAAAKVPSMELFVDTFNLQKEYAAKKPELDKFYTNYGLSRKSESLLEMFKRIIIEEEF